MSWAIWITGLPGSGKSTIARAAAERLAAQGVPVAHLELDELRAILTPAPTDSDAEREVVYRALVFMATALVDAGVPVIVDATAHRRAWRDLARASIERFAEVQIVCPLEVCRAREAGRAAGQAPRGVYAQAGRPGATVPGVDVAYEAALAPELVVDATGEEAESAAARVAVLGLELGATGPAGGAGAGGAVIWITGLPGSGKTTLASRLAEALDADGAPVVLLEWAAARATVLPAGGASERDEDIAHRALVLAATRLADAGRVVVVDATAPRRAWRELARTLVDTFAEVQLVCPAEVCGTRERAGRWTPRPCPSAAGAPAVAAPDLAPRYEYALDPELRVHTDVSSEWSAGADLIAFARRLLARRAPREEDDHARA